MEYTPIGAVTAVPRPAADRAAAYGLEPILVDGNDADAVYAVAERAMSRARDGEGPSLVEALTYRHGGHSRADPGKYRPDDEVQAWLARDPLPSYRARLLESGVDPATLDAIEAEAAAKVAAAEGEAREAPEPSVDVIETQVWADGGSAWRN
jgi:pyruvate dehydrogenase E1 component alpha subunit